MNVRTNLLLVSIIVLVSSMIFASQYATIKSGYDFYIVHPSDADIRYIGNDNSSADGICVLRVAGNNVTTATLVLELGDWSVEWNKTYTAAFGIVNEEPFAVNITDLAFTVTGGTYSYLQVWLHGNGSLRAEDDPTSVFMYDNGTVINDSSTVAWTLGAGDGNPNNISTGSVSINTPWNDDAHVRYSTTDHTAYGVGMAGRTVTNASDYVWVQISVVAESASTHTGIIQPNFQADTYWSSAGEEVGGSSGWCYQETATESTACGGLDTGDYGCSGSWEGGNPCSNTYDGSWVTFGQVDSGVATLYINYTKPSGATNSSRWIVKGNEMGGVTQNLSIPDACWNQDPSTLWFKVESDGNDGKSYWYCYNGAGWSKLHTNTFMGPPVWEEAMNWYIES